MPLDLTMFADKLRRYSAQLDVTAPALAQATGIQLSRVDALLAGQKEPTGDEVLILADFFKCDFKFFISNERLAPFEQTEQLFRKYGDSVTSQDKWAIQEFLFLCECEEFLLANLPNSVTRRPFVFSKKGSFYKGHGQDAALALRRHLGYGANIVPRDVYSDFRSIGIHVFRRRLASSTISGLFLRHPSSGPCVLVNYDEDVYRQRFSAAHEAAHAILDDGKEFGVSFSRWDKSDLSEVRANAFASSWLMPPEFLSAIPLEGSWSQDDILHWAQQLRVNPEPLAYALKEAQLIDESEVQELAQAKLPAASKQDPELPDALPSRSHKRRKALLKRGLSAAYVKLCLDAYDKGEISTGRVAEMLLCDPADLSELADMFGGGIRHER